MYIRNIKRFIPILSVLASIGCNQSTQSKITQGNLIHSTWYNPSEESTLYFKDESTLVYSIFNGYYDSKYSTMIHREECSYSFDNSSKSLNIPQIGLLSNLNLQLKKPENLNKWFIYNAEWGKGWEFQKFE